MKKTLLFLLTSALLCTMTACNEDDELGVNESGIPDNSLAGPSPYVNPEESNVSIPNVGFTVKNKVVTMNMTGIFIKETGDWLDLQGTQTSGQNIWLEIDGKPRSIKTESTESRVSRAKSLVDLVFLVDNSGSMSEEADLLAAEIESWSAKLASMIDIRLGCVGYEDGYISGGLDLNVPDSLYKFLNREYYYGTSRTYGFVGDNAIALENVAGDYSTYGECGGAALHFADQNFNFRSGANRLYVNFTDEPNQPGGETRKAYSVLSVASQETWAVWQGTIHTVFSGGDYYDDTYYWEDYYYEKPWLMSDYTGGTSILDAPADFEGVTLDALPVTGALANSYNVKFHFTEDLATGLHTVKITILSPDNTIKAVREFINVDFSK